MRSLYENFLKEKLELGVKAFNGRGLKKDGFLEENLDSGFWGKKFIWFLNTD